MQLQYAPASVAYTGFYPDRLGLTKLALIGQGLYCRHDPRWLGRGFCEEFHQPKPGQRKGSTGTFAVLQGGLDRAQPLPGDFTLALHADGQWGSQPLIPAEGYFAGGFDTVRGYLQYEAIGDNAVRGRAELTTPELFAIPIDRMWQRRRSSDYTIRVKLAAFYDAAQLWVQQALGRADIAIQARWGGRRDPREVSQRCGAAHHRSRIRAPRHLGYEERRHLRAFLSRARFLTNMGRNGMTYTRMVAGLLVFAYLAQLVIVPVVLANPTGPTVVGGHATVSGLGTSQVTIAQASQQAIINWQQFNIAPNEVTQFIQPNVHAIALNRIFDQNPSQIFGSLSANGTVILLNPNGIMFGPNAQVNVGGLIASSLNLSNANFLAGRYLFEGAGIEGPVKNMGAINASHDGIYLLAPNVENSGVMTSPGGTIVLAAGAKAFLSNRPDGRGFLAEISNPVGQAVNLKDLDCRRWQYLSGRPGGEPTGPCAGE